MAACLRLALMLVVSVALSGGVGVAVGYSTWSEGLPAPSDPAPVPVTVTLQSGPVDSAYVPPTGSGDSAPTVKPKESNQSGGKRPLTPYVLAEGFANINFNDAGEPETGNYSFGLPGYSRTKFVSNSNLGLGTTYRCSIPTSTTPPICDVVVATRDGLATKGAGGVWRPCADGFSPSVFTVPTSGGGVQQPFACPKHLPYVYTSGTKVYVAFVAQVSGEVYNTAGQYKPGTSFLWKIMCNPVRKYGENEYKIDIETPGTTTGNDDKLFEPGVSVASCSKTSNMQLPVLLWDMGRIDSLMYGGGTTRTFDTNRRCPGGYTGRVVMSPPNVMDSYYREYSSTSAFIDHPLAQGLCVQSIANATGAGYRVTFIASAKYGRISYDSTFLQLESFNNMEQAMLGINWQLYCYPPGYPSIPLQRGSLCDATAEWAK